MWTAKIIRYVKWYVAKYEALESARNNHEKKKNLGITEYETLAIIPAAKRVRQPLTWLRVQGTIVTKRTAHEYKDSNPHQYYSAPTHFSTTL